MLNGEWDKIKPVLAEIAPDLRCQFRCPTCSYKHCKINLGIWKRSNMINPPLSVSMTWETMQVIISRLIPYNTAILWTGGGEPTMNPHLIEGMQYAVKHGLKNALYTNGAGLNSEMIHNIFDLEPVFIRVSINCGTPEVHAKFHGYRRQNRWLSVVLRNIECIAREKVRRNSSVETHLSCIFDGRNVDDLKPLAQTLADISLRVGGGIDRIVIRPLINHNNYYRQVPNKVITKASRQLAPGGVIRRIFEDAEIQVHLGFNMGAFTNNPGANHNKCYKREYTVCRASGWFITIGPDGRVYLCCDRNSDPSFEIGDLTQQTIDEIWNGQKRREILKLVNDQKCSRKICAPFCRPDRLNRISHEIAKGNDAFIKWVKTLQQITPNTGRPLFH
jgi:radical SAM protein with 4Fe4S-binding SPASM domain